MVSHQIRPDADDQFQSILIVDFEILQSLETIENKLT